MAQEVSGGLVDQFALGVEQFIRTAEIGFRLLHGRHIQKHQGLAQVMVRAKAADRAGGCGDNGGGLAGPDACAIGA